MKRIDLANHVTGTWISGININLTYEDSGNPVPLTGATVYISFQHLDISAEYYEMSNLPDGGLTISNAAGGAISIDAQLIEFEPGTYEYQVQAHFATGQKHAFLAGAWKITKNRMSND